MIPENTTVKHGTTSMYTYGCRCEKCLAARAEAKREYRYRTRQARPKVAAHIVDGMVRCLQAIGVEKKRISEVAGVGPATLRYPKQFYNGRTAERIEKLHWNAWFGSALLRSHCTCEMPLWVREKWEAA